MNEPSFLQYLLGTLTLATALICIFGKNPVMSAMSLMATLFCTGLLYFTMTSYFIGTVQILIYAGAIAVLFIFIVMLLDLKPKNFTIPGRGVIHVLGALVGIVFLGSTLMAVLPEMGQEGVLNSSLLVNEEVRASALQPESIALRLLSKYMLPFQVTALLLLGAIMGVVVLGKKNMLKEKHESGGQS